MTNMSRAMTRADDLKVYINNAKIVTDKMDIIYLSAIVENLSQQVRSNEKVSRVGIQGLWVVRTDCIRGGPTVERPLQSSLTRPLCVHAFFNHFM